MCKALFGALTSKPYAFIARPWELSSKVSLDFSDSRLFELEYFSRGLEIVRVLPLPSLGLGWITDFTRFAYDGFRVQRLLDPLVGRLKSRVFLPVSWPTAFSYFRVFSSLSLLPFLPSSHLGFERSLPYRPFSGIDAVLPRLVDFEGSFCYRSFLLHFGCKKLFNSSGFASGLAGRFADFRGSFCDSSRYSARVSVPPYSSVDLYIFFKFNPRFEDPLLGLLVRERLQRSATAKVFAFCAPGLSSLTYRYFDLGFSLQTFLKFVSGGHKFSQFLCLNSRAHIGFFYSPARLINTTSSVLSDTFFRLINFSLRLLGGYFYNFCVYPLVCEPSELGFIELGIPRAFETFKKQSSVFYILDSNELLMPGATSGYSLVVYHGAYADSSLIFSDLVFPLKPLFEATGSCLRAGFNPFGFKAVLKPFSANLRDLSSTIRALCVFMGAHKYFVLPPVFACKTFFSMYCSEQSLFLGSEVAFVDTGSIVGAEYASFFDKLVGIHPASVKFSDRWRIWGYHNLVLVPVYLFYFFYFFSSVYFSNIAKIDSYFMLDPGAFGYEVLSVCFSRFEHLYSLFVTGITAVSALLSFYFFFAVDVAFLTLSVGKRIWANYGYFLKRLLLKPKATFLSFPTLLSNQGKRAMWLVMADSSSVFMPSSLPHLISIFMRLSRPVILHKKYFVSDMRNFTFLL